MRGEDHGQEGPGEAHSFPPGKGRRGAQSQAEAAFHSLPPSPNVQWAHGAKILEQWDPVLLFKVSPWRSAAEKLRSPRAPASPVHSGHCVASTSQISPTGSLLLPSNSHGVSLPCRQLAGVFQTPEVDYIGEPLLP